MCIYAHLTSTSLTLSSCSETGAGHCGCGGAHPPSKLSRPLMRCASGTSRSWKVYTLSNALLFWLTLCNEKGSLKARVSKRQQQQCCSSHYDLYTYRSIENNSQLIIVRSNDSGLQDFSGGLDGCIKPGVTCKILQRYRIIRSKCFCWQQCCAVLTHWGICQIGLLEHARLSVDEKHHILTVRFIPLETT